MLPEIKKRKSLYDLVVPNNDLMEIPQASAQMVQNRPTLPPVERKPAGGMSDYELTQNASQDAKAAGVAQMTPEKRAHWARLDNEYAAEKIRRKEEKEQQKKMAVTTNQIGNMVRSGALTPEKAVEVAKLHDIEVNSDYMANYLPKIRDSRRPQLPTLDEYKQQKFAQQQVESNIAVGLPPDISPEVRSKIELDRAKANEANSAAVKNTLPPVISDLDRANTEKVRKETEQIGVAKPQQPVAISAGQSLVDPVSGKVIVQGQQKSQEEMTPYEKLAQKKLDEINRIESIPENQRTKQDKMTLQKLNTGLSADSELKAASELRKEFNANQTIKSYQIVNQSANAIKSAYEMSTNPDTQSRLASDQVLAVAFQKMLDPQSVVRESEYERLPEGAALYSKLAGFLPKLLEGGLSIRDEDRKAVLDMAQKFLEGHQAAINRHINRYNTLAEQYGINSELVTGGVVDKAANSSGSNVSKVAEKFGF
jgi:hypothetical protein